MHGLGHPLGLDVHDVGFTNEPIQAGWVMTCEPAIYIPEEGFAVRLENDIHVTQNGPVDLMAGVPIEAEEIEQLMNSTVRRRRPSRQSAPANGRSEGNGKTRRRTRRLVPQSQAA
jgi:Xaa-Pro aminopeptidase